MTQKKKIDIADWELLEIIEIQKSSPQYTFSCIRKKRHLNSTQFFKTDSMAVSDLPQLSYTASFARMHNSVI